MEAIYLVQNGKPEIAFEKRKLFLREPLPTEVVIEVEAFGLNFADVTSRLGFYRECPPLPTVIGYEVAGRIQKTGSEVQNLQRGDKVIAFTTFGGYATDVITDHRAAIKIDDDYPQNKALALMVQYCTAYYASHVATNIGEGEKVLVQAAAGGVGIALVQLCKIKNCKIYGTAGSQEKISFLDKIGVDVPINYRSRNFEECIDERLDVVFDSIGGKTFKKGMKMLAYGGRMISYGAASQLTAGNFFSKINFGLAFGFYHPVHFIMGSKSLIGVNMLKIGTNKPEILQYCMQQVVKLAMEAKINPHEGGMYPVSKLNEAHRAMENRETIGKIGIFW